MKKVLYWSSIGYILLSSILSALSCVLTIVLFHYRKELPFGAIFLSFILLLFCCFSCFLSLNHKIIVDFDKQVLVLSSFKRKCIDIKNIREIEIDTTNSIDEKKYCFVWFRTFDGADYKFPEYGLLFKKHQAVAITQEKISLLKQYLFKTN
jgi:hypothetical protein